ncbi:MAG: tetratricopeptide repeat protein [Bacillota bacterium]
MGHADRFKWVAPPLLVLMGAGAFWDGLYAPGQQMVAVALAALLALAVGGRVSLARLEAAGAVLLVAGAALSLASPAQSGVAAHGPAVVAGWLLALIAGRALAERGGGPAAERVLARFWAVSGTLMAFAGALAISFTPIHHSGRLAALLGYPNAVGMLGLLGLAGALPDLAAGHRWAPLLALGNALSLLLSGSRWVWATGLLLALYLAWAAPDLLRRAVRPALAPLAIALAAALWAAPAVAGREARTLAMIVLISLLTWLGLQTFQRNRPVLAGAAVAWAGALAMAPGWPWLLGRATALPLTEGSSVERLTFLQDGLRLLIGLPWGAGYRGWNALHLQAASYGYYSAEVHSAPLDLAIAFGWLGGLGFLLLLARFFAFLRHGRQWEDSRLVVLAGLAALALHALLDWDLSYALFAFPLWFGFGLASSGAGPGPAPPLRWPPWLTAALASLALAASSLLGAGDLFTARAERSLRQGAPEAALLHAGAAAAVTPWNDLSHAYRGVAASRLGLSDQALASFERARALGPLEPWYAQLLASELAQQGRWREAAATWREAAALWPWHVPAYEQALQAHVDLIARARVAGQGDLAVEIAQSGEALLGALRRQKEREPAEAPRRPMEINTPAIQQAEAVIRQTLGR